MPTTYKTLGQTTATAASATTTVNSVTDPTIEGLTTGALTNISANRLVTFTGATGTIDWRLMAETATNRFMAGTVDFSNANKAYAGSQSLWCEQTNTGTNQIGFTTAPATTSTTLSFSGTGSINSTLVTSAISVSSSTTYYYGAYVNETGTTSTTATFTVKWYGSTGTYISQNSFNTTINTDTWTKINSSATSPSTAAYAAIYISVNIGQNVKFGIDNIWFSTDSAASTTFPTPSADTNNVVLTAPFNKRGENIWSGTANASTTVTTFAGALTDLYTAPASTQTVVSTITATNLTTSATSCRVLVLPSGQTAAAKNFIVFDGTLPANSTEAYTLGITLAAGDKIQVASDVANVSFSAFGSEIS